MYSATRMNQFEMKDTYFLFVINVSGQGSNVKIKYDLKINLQRLQSCLVSSRHIHNSVKQIVWIYRKNSQRVNTGNYFCKKLYLRCFSGSWICLRLSSLETSVFFCYFFHFESIKVRSSRWQMYFKIEVFKNFAIFTGKHMCWSLFVMKLLAYKPANLLKRDSNTSIFLLILPNF